MDDTHPTIRRVHAALLREAGASRRLAMACDLTQQTLCRARHGIALAHPGMSEQEQAIFFVKANYGRTLGEGLERHLQDRRCDHAAAG